MAINVEVKAKNGENSSSILRRFSQKVRKANVVGRTKGVSQKQKPLSDFQKKKAKLRKIENQKKYEKLYKLGKIGGRYSRR